MKARDIVGKTIRKVVQQRCSKDNGGDVVYHIDCIIFDDGSYVTFRVAELPGDYAVFGTFFPKEAAPAKEPQP